MTDDDAGPGGAMGLHCPACGEDLRNRSIAKSHPTVGGQRRMRWCACGRQVESTERVEGPHSDAIVIDIESLSPSRRSLLRALLREIGATFQTSTGT